jgi:hypothetical protein
MRFVGKVDEKWRMYGRSPKFRPNAWLGAQIKRPSICKIHIKDLLRTAETFGFGFSWPVGSLCRRSLKAHLLSTNKFESVGLGLVAKH